MARGLTAKFRLMLEAYTSEAALDGPKACRIAGYADPDSSWQRLRKKHAKLIAEAEYKFREGLKLSWEETQEILSQIARDPRHKDRLKAVELSARLHGKLDSKINVNVTRGDIEGQLADLLRQMALNHDQAQLAAGATLPQLATGQDGAGGSRGSATPKD